MSFYHISESPLPKIIYPRIPGNYYTKRNIEDNIIPRVCFAPTIDQCLMAKHNTKNKLYYVYEPMYYGNLKIVEAREIIKHNLVPDADITHEIWALNPVELKLVGIIKPLEPTERVFKLSKNINDEIIKLDIELWAFNWVNL